MYRHVALFRWTADATDEERRRVPEALAGLPATIPEIRAYSFGPDVGGADGHWDFAVIADFDDRAGWQAYQDHPDHQRVVRDVVAPIRAERATLQYIAD
jgi:hypothetical protein